ncbi:maleylpyruvate isomerase family mycothiol-dependent enzyme [Rhodococcus spelaei]|uniref:Maleylpyruvate isomerase family mycothiol-dependent enzyme n=1 Tax=Rhodococcus spelaei TaxID=2546320 RepID=A0A541B0B8_9NOCA|nr:maleylpyruvate isomerase family mycothiol-dependent enzyme [Rhodococcus spelaei]TQF65758.1 maleylpyruvate isomerase family mycothiol-dependent enzyme [Rhodococcus spelaei]
MSDARKPTLVEKQPLTAALIEEWDKIGFVLDGLSPEQWSAPSPLPGWSVHDVVSHLIGTESLLSGVEPPVPEEAVPAADHVHNPIGAYNERWVIGLRERTPAQMLAAFRDITIARAEALEAMTQDDFDAPAMTPVGPDSYGRFMRTRLFDCWFHEHDIRDAVDLPGDEGGPRAEYALAEILAGLGFAVGKKGHAPQGSSVTFDLSGPLARRIHVAVDGRAAVVPALDGPATATLGMDSRLFTRLCGGRVNPTDHLGEITFGGDEELGRRVATNLPFTI